jgi:GT2 family glycosyltransferase
MLINLKDFVDFNADPYCPLDASKPIFSIIIPTHKRFGSLCKCLDQVSHYFVTSYHVTVCFPIETIVSDDGRDDELKLFLQQRYSWCKYTQGPARGPAANRNHGAGVAQGEWLVFTDDDCLPQPGWIEAFASNASQCDVMEGKTSAEGHRTRVDEECPTNENGGFLWSCNFAIRSEAFFMLNGFNEDFPAPTMEDVEFRKRLQKSDLRLKFVSSAQVNHPWRRTKGRSFLRVKAECIATYVSLHPESAHEFSLIAQLIRFLTSVWLNIQYSVSNFNLNGVIRQTLLDVYASVLTWQAVQRIKLKMIAVSRTS